MRRIRSIPLWKVLIGSSTRRKKCTIDSKCCQMLSGLKLMRFLQSLTVLNQPYCHTIWGSPGIWFDSDHVLNTRLCLFVQAVPHFCDHDQLNQIIYFQTGTFASHCTNQDSLLNLNPNLKDLVQLARLKYWSHLMIFNVFRYRILSQTSSPSDNFQNLSSQFSNRLEKRRPPLESSTLVPNQHAHGTWCASGEPFPGQIYFGQIARWISAGLNCVIP